MHSEKTFEAYRHEVRQNVRWNFLFNSLDGILFVLALAFIEPGSVLPAFIRRLGGSDFLVSVIPAAQAMGWMTPQIFISNFVERLSRKKPFVVGMGVVERLPYLSIIALCFLLASSQHLVLLVVCLSAIFGAALASGFNSPGWFDMVTKVTPLRHRGKLSAVRMTVGTLLGIGAGWVVEWVLDQSHISFPRNYGFLFVTALFFMSLSLVCMASVREPVYPGRHERLTLRNYLSKLPAILKKEKNFRNFLVGTFLQRATFIALAFYAINGLEKFGLPDKWVGRFTVSIMVGRVLATPVFGLLGDRFGHKINLVVGAVAHFAAAVFAITAPNEWSYLPAFALASVGVSADQVSRFNMVAEFCEPARRPTYIALSNSLLGPTACIVLLGGAFVKTLGYDGLFVIAGLFALGSAACLVFGVREPRKFPHAAVVSSYKQQW